MQEQSVVNEDIAELPELTRKLYRFIGNWKLSGVYRRNGRASRVEGRFDVSPAAGGFGLLARMHAEVEGLGSYEEVDMLGYDPGCDEYHIFYATNGADTHDHSGDFADENSLTLRYRGLRDGERFLEEDSIEFRIDDEFRLRVTDKVSDRVVSETETTMQRL
jgi:hypothetical protein